MIISLYKSLHYIGQLLHQISPLLTLWVLLVVLLLVLLHPYGGQLQVVQVNMFMHQQILVDTSTQIIMRPSLLAKFSVNNSMSWVQWWTL
jgi:hypothetical protein